MTKLKSFFLPIAVTFMLLFAVPFAGMAQCPMCRASAEASIKNGSSVALGLNDGILYLLAMPYLVIGVIAFLWYRNYRKKSSRTHA